jgi:nucleoside-diphosphate-sugar epimerase
MVQIAKKSKVQRFIYASSSSVYGLKSEKNVTEEVSLEPLTDYSKFKVECEKILKPFNSEDFTTVTIRPATVCGYSRRQRLDVVVNILTNLAFNKREISIFGGKQLRPNIHIDDMVRSYILMLEAKKNDISGEVFNVGYDNLSIENIATKVKNIVGEDVMLKTTPTDDNRSYHISSNKIKKQLDFSPMFGVEDAIRDLKSAFEKKLLPDSLSNDVYFNIKRMEKIKLK